MKLEKKKKCMLNEHCLCISVFRCYQMWKFFCLTSTVLNGICCLAPPIFEVYVSGFGKTSNNGIKILFLCEHFIVPEAKSG